MNSRALVRRLVRLDLAVEANGRAETIVRGPSGAVATIGRGHWSRRQVEDLLQTLAVPTAEFENTR